MEKRTQPSERPYIVPDGIFGGRKRWKILTEEYSTINDLPLFRHCWNIPAFVRIFWHLSDYSDTCSGEVPIFHILKQKLLVQMFLQVN